MAFRWDQTPPVLDAAHLGGGTLYGAAAVGLDRITSEVALADRAERSG